MGMALTEKDLDEAGKPKLRANEYFLKVMLNYF